MALFKKDLKATIKDKAVEIFEKRKHDPSVQMLHRIWYRNILYLIGEQYIEWVRTQKTFRRKPTHPFIPTPVANTIRDYVDAMVAIITNKDYTISIFPNSKDVDDANAASLARDILKSADAEEDELFFDEIEKTCVGLLYAGVGYNRTHIDTNGGDGIVIKSGEVVSYDVLPFNVVLDDYGSSLKRKRYTGVISLKDKEWVEDTFKIKCPKSEDLNVIDYQKRLMKMVGNVSPWKSDGMQLSILNEKDEDLVIFRELEFRPNDNKYDNGLYISMVGDKVCEFKEALPIPLKDGHWEYTLTDFHYHYVPGRFTSDPGINDQISPQNSINEIDQSLSINRKTFARPFLFTPMGVKLNLLSKYGQAMLAIEYDALLSGGAKPEIHKGTPLPDQVIQERMIHKETSQDSAGDPKGVLRGKPASARSSGVQVDILKETAELTHSPRVRKFFRSLKRVYRKRLILYSTLPEKRLAKIPGKGNRVRLREYKGTDIRGNYDVRLELVPKIASTNAGQTQVMLEMGQYGFFGDLVTNPQMRRSVLDKMGLKDIDDTDSRDVDRALDENFNIYSGRFEEIMVTEPDAENEDSITSLDPIFKYDNHGVHYEIHRGQILSDEFREWSKKSREVMMKHTDVHYILMQAAIRAQEEKEMAMILATKGGGQENNNNPPGEEIPD